MKLGKITINRKHEMFWNKKKVEEERLGNLINRKHEMFRNLGLVISIFWSEKINRKHEMFWNQVEF